MEVYGKNVAIELLTKNKKINKIYLLEGFSDQKIISMIRKQDISFSYETKSVFGQFASSNHQGIICFIPEFYYTPLNEVLKFSKVNPVFLMLDHIEDPHNFGAIIRTAVAGGVDAIIIPKDRGVKVNATVFKTSAGTSTRIPIVQVTNLNQTMKKMKEKGIWFVGTSIDAKQMYTEIDYKMPLCLVVGNEGEGISNLIAKNCDFNVKIPLKNNVESLNVSVATGILIYEIMR